MLKGLKVVFVAYVHNIDTFNAMSKGPKKALTVLIVTHVTHVKRVESGVCGLCTQYRYIQCYVERVKRLCYVETRDKHIFAQGLFADCIYVGSSDPVRVLRLLHNNMLDTIEAFIAETYVQLVTTKSKCYSTGC